MTKKKLEAKKHPIVADNSKRCSLKVLRFSVLLVILIGMGVMLLQIMKFQNLLEEPQGKISFSKTVCKNSGECKCASSSQAANNSDEADKYKAALLAKEIIERIDDTRDYTDKLEALKPLLKEQFTEEVQVLDKNKAMVMPSLNEMVETIESTAVPYKIPAETPGIDKSKLSIASGLFKVSGAEEWRVKCNPAIIDKAIQAIREKNEWDAVQILEQFEPQSDEVKKVIDNLTLRNTLKYYLGTITNNVLNNG